MRNGIFGLVLLALLPFCAACGGGGHKLPLEALEDAYYQMTCTKFVGCAEETFISVLIPDEAACVEFFQSAYAEGPGSIADIIAAVEAGRIRYNGRAASRCLEEQRAYGCDEFGKIEPEACQKVFSGTLEDGAACELNPECVSGYCDTAQECPGTCLPVVPAGQGCDLDAECTPGTHCVRGTCQAWTADLTAGDDCEPGDNDWCGEGLFCNEETEECAARVAVGGSCAGVGDAECVFGALCIADASGVSTCVALTIADQEGAVCDTRNGILCAMYAGLSCRIDDFEAYTGTCVQAPGPGDTCFVSGQTPSMTQCSFLDRLYCDVPPDYQDDGICVPLKADGAACSGDDCLGYCNGDGVCETDSDSVCP